jgi:hypothetical protein
MSVFSITAFRSALAGGARPNLFKFQFGALPSGVASYLTGSDVLIKAGAIPGYTLGVIEVPFRSRRIKVPGDRTFAEWTVTVINNESQSIRRGFEAWMSYITHNDFASANLRRAGSGVDYTTQITVQQLKDDNSVSKETKLFHAFPTDVSTIDLSYDTTDAVEEFTVTFQYVYSA